MRLKGLFIVLIVLGAYSATAAKWEATGVLSDACQCEVFCPCEFLSLPTYNHCDDAAIMHFQKASYGDVVLDGMSVAVVSQSREGKRLIDTVGDLKFARIFVPDTATDEQTEALAGIVRRVFGAFVGETARISPDEMVSRVKMTTKVEDNHHAVEIPGILSLDIETITGGDGETPIMVQNNAFTAFGFSDVKVGKSKTYRYTHDGVDWDYGGRSASIRSFEMSGDTEAPPAEEAPATQSSEHGSEGAVKTASAKHQCGKACCAKHGKSMDVIH